MERGTVSWFENARGFGFLKSETGENRGKEFFCHFTAIQCEGYKTLAEGQEVTFDLEVGPKQKLQACNVRPL